MICAAVGPEQKAALLTYLAARIGEKPEDLVGAMPFAILGSVRGNRLVGAIVFLNYRRQSMEFHLAGAPGWVTRAEVKQLFRYAFIEAKCLRLWCLIKRNNKTARQGAERLGFKLLGVARDEFGEGRDGIIYSMRRRDCRWLT